MPESRIHQNLNTPNICNHSKPLKKSRKLCVFDCRKCHKKCNGEKKGIERPRKSQRSDNEGSASKQNEEIERKKKNTRDKPKEAHEEQT